MLVVSITAALLCFAGNVYCLTSIPPSTHPLAGTQSGSRVGSFVVCMRKSDVVGRRCVCVPTGGTMMSLLGQSMKSRIYVSLS